MKSIEEMAREAGFNVGCGIYCHGHDCDDCTGELTRFADLIRTDATDREPDGWRWRFLAGKDRTWRHQATKPAFDSTIVEAEPMFLRADIVLPGGE